MWLPDGNVAYLKGKHIALVLVALLIILVGFPYTTVLFLDSGLFMLQTGRFTLHMLIPVHHVPYDIKYRYWTGLLLLARVFLYITASVTVSNSDKPHTALLSTKALVGGLLFLTGAVRTGIYRKSAVQNY